jgi:hypothetical protein
MPVRAGAHVTPTRRAVAHLAGARWATAQQVKSMTGPEPAWW